MSPALGNAIVLTSILVLMPILFMKKLRTSELWQATVTPLASIIGSGFLISAPLVILTAGQWATVVMFTVVFIAYLLGNTMRFNIIHLEPLLAHRGPTHFVIHAERFSKVMLGFAYVISAAFYIKLLSIFVLQAFMIKNSMYENIITTLILIFIGVIGWLKGLHALEILEKYSVSAKLIIILTLIVGNIFYNINTIIGGEFYLPKHDYDSLFQSFRKILGILIIVQGFETSRYLGQEYSKTIRIRSMKYAQLISGGIYILFISSSMVMFKDIHHVTETVVIDLCHLIAPILPSLLIFAAIMSQFSASIADTIGSSGLISEATKKMLSVKQGILITLTIAVLIIWITNIYEIIVLASKAFSLYYFIQCIIAAKIAKSKHLHLALTVFTLLAFLMLLVFTISIPVA